MGLGACVHGFSVSSFPLFFIILRTLLYSLALTENPFLFNGFRTLRQKKA
jgi:hypothetical protein